ncbi:MAG: hypothetical protein AMXMBFR82_43830 [Candidatus Hydrogenedentota bacterium]
MVAAHEREVIGTGTEKQVLEEFDHPDERDSTEAGANSDNDREGHHDRGLGRPEVLEDAR